MRTPVPVLLVLSLALLASGCRTNSAFPHRPVTLIVPWSVGGGTDRLARQIAAQLEQELGVPVHVVNASGGAGVTGHTRGALARPDGHTMTMITAELSMLHWRGLTNISYRDFRPLMRINRDHAALFTLHDAPWESIQDLEVAIRERPGGLRASGTAFGGIWHVALAGWLIRNDLDPSDLVWLSLNGSAPSLQELMAGGVDLVSCSVPEARSLLDAGEIRSLAIMSDERLPALPHVPTLKETGTDWTTATWRGLALPLGVPEERAQFLEEAVRRVVESREFLHFCEQAGFGTAADGADAFRTMLAEEDEAFGEIFRSAAFEPVRKQRYGPWLFPSVIAVLLLVALGSSLVGALRSSPVASMPVSGRAAAPASPPWAGKEVPHGDGNDARTPVDPYTENERDPARVPIPAEEAPTEHGTRPGFRSVSGAVGGIVLYVLLSETLGFLVTATLLLLGLFSLLRVRWLVALPTAVAGAALSYYVFGVLLRVPLPWGILGW